MDFSHHALYLPNSGGRDKLVDKEVQVVKNFHKANINIYIVYKIAIKYNMWKFQ